MIDDPANDVGEHAVTGVHEYLSTACLHAEHGYCQGAEGERGPKRPGVCKFCDASCRCACHHPGVRDYPRSSLDSFAIEIDWAEREILLVCRRRPGPTWSLVLGDESPALPELVRLARQHVREDHDNRERSFGWRGPEQFT